jgi:hypothetical protein
MRQGASINRRRLVGLLVAVAACGGGTDPGGTQEPEYTPGQSYFGTNQYIEYIAGDLPLIFTAPHGGLLTPESIPVRTEAACGTDTDQFATVTDANTQDLARRIQAAFAQGGRYPHVIINRLARSRLDANRDIGMAACDDAAAELAWMEYHEFITNARDQILEEHGKGWYTDLHGHGHEVQRLELGYGLSAATLRLTDEELNPNALAEDASSIRVMSEQSPLSFSALLRGPASLGTLFGDAGFPAVPSQQDPAPDVGEAYFSGGYNTNRYGCSNGGAICGVQIEMNFTGVRDTPTNREAFAQAIRAVYAEYLAEHYGITLP